MRRVGFYAENGITDMTVTLLGGSQAAIFASHRMSVNPGLQWSVDDTGAYTFILAGYTILSCFNFFYQIEELKTK